MSTAAGRDEMTIHGASLSGFSRRGLLGTGGALIVVLGISLDCARAAGNTHVEGAVWPTDHPFSDKRIALSQALVAWLGTLGAQH